MSSTKKVDLIQNRSPQYAELDLLKQLGQLDRPILLKRGLNATYEEWIMSAEYIMQPETRMSSSANAESVLLKLIPETHWICRASLF